MDARLLARVDAKRRVVDAREVDAGDARCLGDAIAEALDLDCVRAAVFARLLPGREPRRDRAHTHAPCGDRAEWSEIGNCTIAPFFQGDPLTRALDDRTPRCAERAILHLRFLGLPRLVDRLLLLLERVGEALAILGGLLCFGERAESVVE